MAGYISAKIWVEEKPLFHNTVSSKWGRERGEQFIGFGTQHVILYGKAIGVKKIILVLKIALDFLFKWFSDLILFLRPGERDELKV